MGTTLFFLTSGLFLGWSLGANDAANIFGTAVGSRMIRFVAAAWICSICLVLGAVLGGAGAAHGLGELGAINTLPGSFTVALAAALTVYWMTRLGLPVSTTQAIVGGIVGWNVFSGSSTDMSALTRIVTTWVACPILGAVCSALLYRVTVFSLRSVQPHLLRRDFYTRWGLILAGAFGSYSLGANNIGNVMGVFVSSSPFREIPLGSWGVLSSTHQLFLLGALAIALGVFTYSRRVMLTVGQNLMPLSPVAAWVVVVSHSLVLFLFSSTRLEQLLVDWGLPPVPLIPVSSSQAVIGAVLGVAFVQARGKALRQVRWNTLFSIASGWVSTPVVAALISVLLLFVMQNVFLEKVYHQEAYCLSHAALERLQQGGIDVTALEDLEDLTFSGSDRFSNAIAQRLRLTPEQSALVLDSAHLQPTLVTTSLLARLDRRILTRNQFQAVEQLVGRRFRYAWQLRDTLAVSSDSWRQRPATPVHRWHNEQLDLAWQHLWQVLQSDRSGSDGNPAAVHQNGSPLAWGT